MELIVPLQIQIYQGPKNMEGGVCANSNANFLIVPQAFFPKMFAPLLKSSNISYYENKDRERKLIQLTYIHPKYSRPWNNNG